MSPLDLVLSKLTRPKRSGAGWVARCAAHDDRQASLSVGVGEDGRVLMKCFAGCELPTIVAALGLELRDLFQPRARDAGSDGRRPTIALSDLAAHKHLPTDFLRGFGLHDLPGGGVGIPYRDTNGETIHVKRRTALVAMEGSYWPARTPLMAYGLDRLADAREVGCLVAVEGESDTWTGAYHGFPMLGIPGATGAAVLDTAHLDSIARLYVLREPDRGGAAFVAGIAARLEAIGWTGRASVVTLAVKDVNELHKADPDGFRVAFRAALDAAIPLTADVVAEAVAASKPDPAPWLPPTPFAVMHLPAFPLDALPPWLAEYAGAVALATQTPAELPALLGLAVIAAACARRVMVLVWDDWREPVNLYILIVLPPANRKSAVFAELVAPLLEFEAEEAARLAPEIKAAETARRIAESALKKAEDAAARAEADKREFLQAEAERLARELVTLPSLVQPRLVVDDCSAERLASLLHEQGGRIAVMSPEGGVFDLMAGRYSATGLPNFEVFLKGHAGDTVIVDRVGRTAERIDHPAITMGLTVQPEVLRGLVRRPGFRGRGLLARFVYSVPASLIGRRAVRPPGVREDVRAEYARRIRTLLDQSQPNDSEPITLRLTPAARERLEAFATGTEPRLAEHGDLGHVADWGGKLVGMVVRLAGLLHLAEQPDPSIAGGQAISAQTVTAALRIGEYAVEHARAAFAEMGADPALDDARHVWGWIDRQDRDALSKRDIFEGVKGRFRRVEMLDPALQVLEEYGYVRVVPLSSERDGPGRKPSPTYEVNPLGRSRNSPDSQNAEAKGNSANRANTANGMADDREVFEL